MEKKTIDLLDKHFPLKVIGRPGFWVKFTPLWFQFVGWILAIGAIDAISKITSNGSLHIILSISYSSFLFFIHDHLSLLRFNFPLIRSNEAERIISIIISTLATIIVWHFVSGVIGNLNLKGN